MKESHKEQQNKFSYFYSFLDPQNYVLVTM